MEANFYQKPRRQHSPILKCVIESPQSPHLVTKLLHIPQAAKVVSDSYEYLKFFAPSLQNYHIKRYISSGKKLSPLISICDYNVALIRLVPLCSPLSNIKLMVLATLQRAQMLRQIGTRAGSDLQVHLVVNSRSIQHLLPVQECPLFHSHLIQFVYDNTVSVNNMHLKFEMVLSSRPHPRDSVPQLQVL
jgi:hypothetical protein